jgi:hypothetical protein
MVKNPVKYKELLVRVLPSRVITGNGYGWLKNHHTGWELFATQH